MSGWDGLLLVDKAPGPTSHDVVAHVRRAIGGQIRVGHAGTLDPPASGLLPLVLGRATRLVRFLPAAPKVYVGELCLGLTTDTDDVAGRVTARHAGSLPAHTAVRDAARDLVGAQSQVPPAVSARHVAGQRMYHLARRGIRAVARPSDVVVTRFDVEPGAEPGLFSFAADVSSGTYVRALVRDLGAALGCGAAVARLRRTRIGPFAVDSAVPVGHARPLDLRALREAVVPLDALPLELPAWPLVDAAGARAFCSGLALAQPLPADEACAGPYRVVTASGALLGVGTIEDGRLKPQVVVAVPEREA